MNISHVFLSVKIPTIRCEQSPVHDPPVPSDELDELLDSLIDDELDELLVVVSEELLDEELDELLDDELEELLGQHTSD